MLIRKGLPAFTFSKFTETTYYCYQKLSDIAEQLKDDGFVRCHQSYLFPLNKVTHYSSTHVYIHDIQLPISNQYQTSVRELLSQSNMEKGTYLSPAKSRIVSYNDINSISHYKYNSTFYYLALHYSCRTRFRVQSAIHSAKVIIDNSKAVLNRESIIDYEKAKNHANL